MTEQEQDFAPDEANPDPVEVQEDVGEGEQPDPSPPAPQWEPEVEEEARLLGWKSPDEWQGERPQNYIDNPTEFMERLERIGPFRKFREHSEEKLRRMEAAFEAREARDRERMVQEYEQQLDSITRRQRQAVDMADTKAWDEAEQDRRKLEQYRPQQQAPAPDPYLQEYAASDDGGWLKDPLLVSEGYKLIEDNPHIKALGTPQQIEFAQAELRKKYPGKFKSDEPKADPKPRVDGGGQGVFKKKTGFDSLPPDVRKEFKRQVEKGRFSDSKDDKEFFYDAYTNG